MATRHARAVAWDRFWFSAGGAQGTMDRACCQTNVLTRNVSGIVIGIVMVSAIVALCAITPMHTPTKFTAITNNRRMPNPANPSSELVWMRQPVASAAKTIVIVPTSVFRTWYKACPTSTADRDIGSDRKLFMAHDDDIADPDVRFEMGLQLLLDGVAFRLNAYTPDSSSQSE